MPGPFYFAWVDGTETTFTSDHHVEDESVFGFELEQTEGEFAELRVDIRHPHTGLLAPGRKLWVWFSWFNGTSVVPLFFGRLVGLPTEVHGEVASLTFVARPDDFDDQKRTLATTLKVSPWWDPVWIAPERRDDPDVILEALPSLWHIDRVTHDVTVSSIASGEAGTALIDGDFFEGSLAMSFRQTPVSKISCTATVAWDQVAAGEIDLSAKVAAAFNVAGSFSGVATSFTGEGLQRDWPKAGDHIGGGWSVGFASGERLDGTTHAQTMTVVKTVEADLAFPLWTLRPVFIAAYDVSRQRSETISFAIEADVQQLISAPREEERLTVNFSSSEIDSPVDPGGLLPIRDRGRRTYFKTDRGQQSLRYLIALCRARLLMRARAVGITASIPFANAVGISCRHSAQFVDDRLPGGQATGKVIGYRLLLNGDTGEAVGELTVGCMIGKGNTLSATVAVPTYVATGYVDTGYQVMTDEGVAIAISIGDVAYSDFSGQAIDDDGIDLSALSAANVVESIIVVNGETTQRALLAGTTYEDMSEAVEALNISYTQVAMTLKPLVGGPFETTFAVATTALMILKTIDLEAP